MAWQKLGLVFQPNRDLSWGESHATAPSPIQLDSGVWRVFFARRDGLQRSHVGWFDIDLDDPASIRQVSHQPLLAPGPIGNFDGNGIFATGVVRTGPNALRLYTVGWNPGHRHPLFYAAIGVADSNDMGLTIARRSKAPVLDRSEHDPAAVTGPWVAHERGRFRMWYVSGLGWEESEAALKSRYHIKYAESADGLVWSRSGVISIDFINPDETNIARPCVVEGPDGYEAWFSYERGQGYRMGYGRSKDGVRFERLDAPSMVLTPTAGSFDSDAVCHPAIVSHNGTRFMFYNGNRFGIDGVALAKEVR